MRILHPQYNIEESIRRGTDVWQYEPIADAPDSTYHVEQILLKGKVHQSKTKWAGTEAVFVKWQGYDTYESCTWEAWDSIKACLIDAELLVGRLANN